MQILRRRSFLAGAFSAAGIAAAFAAQDRFAEVEIEATEVAGSVHVLQGAGGNIGLSVGDDGVLQVDSQFLELAPRIEAAIEELGGDRPRWLVNTHWHGDHTGGNARFGETAAVVAHENVRKRLTGEVPTEGREAGDQPQRALPAVTYEEGASLWFNGEEVRLLHLRTGAHTDGDTVVWFTGSNVIHMGDLYFQSGYPFVDLASGGDVRGMIASVEAALELAPEGARIIPGHGELSDVEGLREYLAMLEGTVAAVEGALEEGLDAEAMHERDLLAEWNGRWGGSGFMPPERYLSILAENLSR